MKSRTRISGAVAASLALATGACADGREAPTAPQSAAPPAADRVALVASAGALGDVSSRLAATVRDADRRARLAGAVERLERAMAAGDVAGARRALESARAALRHVDSEVERDAIGLALDAAAETLDGKAR